MEGISATFGNTLTLCGSISTHDPWFGTFDGLMPGVVIVGAVESTEVAIEAAARVAGWRVRMVVTLPPELAGRHTDFRDLSAVAKAAGAELLCAARINDADIVDRIRSAQPDLILVVGWSQLCGREFLDILPDGTLGYHPAALPRLRGRAAIPWTILNAEPITAGTLFWMDQGMDSGAILEQHFFHVAPDETARSLYAKHMCTLDAMVASGLASIGRGEPVRRIQDERCATYAARRTQRDGQIDWSMPTAAIERLVRAVGKPYPGAFSRQGDDQITLWEASAQTGDQRYLAAPGQIVETNGSAFRVKTIDGLLHVTQWESRTGSPPKLHSMLGRQA